MASRESNSIRFFAALFVVICGCGGDCFAQDKTLSITESPIDGIAVSPDGKYLAVSTYQFKQRIAEIGVFDLEKEKRIYTLQNKRTDLHYGILFSKDGKRLLSLMPGAIVNWDVESGKEQNAFEIFGQGPLTSENYFVGVVDKERTTATIVDLKTGKPGVIKDLEMKMELVRISSDGKYLATTQRDGLLKVWDVSTGKAILTKDHKYHIKRLFFIDNDSALAVSMASKLAVYDLKTGKTSGPDYFPPDAYSADFKMMACIGRLLSINKEKLEDLPYGLHVFSRPKGHVIATIPVEANSSTPHILFSPDGRYLYASGKRGTVRVWNLSNLKPQ